MSCAEGLLKLACTSPSEIGLVNLATGHSVSIREFAESAAQILSMPSGLLRFGELPTRPAEMMASGVDVSLLRSMTGWVPPTTISVGIARTMDFCQRLAQRPKNYIVSN